MEATIDQVTESEQQKEHIFCHIPITNPFRDGYGKSYCRLKSFTPRTLVQHSKEVCRREHTLCVICISEYERIHNRPYFS